MTVISIMLNNMVNFVQDKMNNAQIKIGLDGVSGPISVHEIR